MTGTARHPTNPLCKPQRRRNIHRQAQMPIRIHRLIPTHLLPRLRKPRLFQQPALNVAQMARTSLQTRELHQLERCRRMVHVTDARFRDQLGVAQQGRCSRSLEMAGRVCMYRGTGFENDLAYRSHGSNQTLHLLLSARRDRSRRVHLQQAFQEPWIGTDHVPR